jgi:hypothetical protein
VTSPSTRRSRAPAFRDCRDTRQKGLGLAFVALILSLASLTFMAYAFSWGFSGAPG